ncbi:hypothetical protein [Listeria aquatica]|uniref:arsenate reductase/protein-tyrosine-phosphatase family protein n=1 Tax=Listeria aquatica TaxID=1494960 RepID=UPI003D0784CF
MNVLIICTGNTCRSPIAEGILRAARPDILVRSRGLNAEEVCSAFNWSEANFTGQGAFVFS